MKTRKNHILFYSIVLVLLSLALLVTCKAGLGESVDTTPPKLSIAYPPANSIIRDWFMMSGLAEDETFVKDVTVVFKGKETHTFNAVVDKEKKQWTLDLNRLENEKYPLEDGKYDVTVTAIDSANRKASSSVTYYIDNTPPILVLQRPSTRGAKDGELVPPNLLDPYGEIIKFTGNWWDANSSEGAALSIHFFKEDGVTPVDDYETYETMIRTQNFDLEIAKDTNGELWEALKDACDVSDGSPVATAFTYTISLQDDAKVWQSPDQNAPTKLEGNTTKHYYINRDITANLGGGSAPSFRELSAHENGESVTIPEALKDKLKDIRIPAAPNPWKETMGKFTFDPENKSPSISILGMDSFVSGDNVPDPINQSSALPTFNIQIKPNKDNKEIIDKSIVIKLYSYGSSGDLNLRETKTVESKELKTGSIGEIVTLNYNVSEVRGSYCLEIYAEDVGNNQITQRYGFTINDGAPQLLSLSPDRSPAVTKVNTKDDKITVLVKGEDGGDKVDVIISEMNGTIEQTINLAPEDIVLEKVEKENGGWAFTWTLTLPAPSEGEEKTYRFWLNDGTYDSNKRQIEFLADNTPPKIQGLTKPVIYRDNFPYEGTSAFIDDQIVTIRGFADEDLEEAIFIFVKKDEPKPAQPTELTIGDWSKVPVDNQAKNGTKGFGGDVPFKKDVTAPEGEYTLYACFADDTFEPEFLNYGPVIKIMDLYYDEAAPTFTETKSGIEGTSLVYRNANVSFGGTVSDSNGIESLTVKVNDEDPVGIEFDGNEWSYLLEEEGEYNIEFVAKDKAGRAEKHSRTLILDKKAPNLSNITDLTTNWLFNVAAKIEGTVSDNLSGIASVQYELSNDGGLNWGAANNFTVSGETFSGTVVFADGEQNRIRITATDRAGNFVTSEPQTVQIDTTPPNIDSILAPTGTPIVNGTKDLTVTIKASDIGSGLQDAQISSDPSFTTSIQTITSFTEEGVATFTVPAGTISNLEDVDTSISAKLYVRVRDKAGRPSANSVINLIVDRKAPTGEITSHLEGATVNKIIDITGTASDDNGLASTGVFEVQKGGIWVELEDSVEVSGSNWTVKDFNTASYIPNSGTLNVRYGVVDIAGNTGYITRTLNVDQDSDRPVIKLSNIKLDGTSWLKNTNTIFGSVSDDDGLVSSVEVSLDGTNFESTTIDGGSWEYDFMGDGIKTVYFRVVDSKGTTFTTNASEDLNKPKLQEKSGTPETKNSITFRVDTENPVIGAEILSNGQELTTGATFGGGESNTIIISGTATDANGIASVTVEIEGLSPITATLSETQNTFTFTTGEILLEAVEDGTRTITITAIDEAGLKATATRTIRVDNTPPTVSFQSPLNGATVNGDIEVKGIADDGLGTGISSIKYQVGKNAVIDPSSDQWKNVTDSGVSWLIDFKNLNTINNFAEEMYGTETSTGSGLWDVPLILRVEDNAGNVRVTSKNDYYLRVDPSGDIPKVTLIYPDPTKEKTVLGGIIRIFGSAEDDDAVHSVWMQVGQGPSNNIVPINDAEMGDWTGNGKQVNGTVSWNMSINTEGEFDPAENSTENNTIYFRLKARDINGTESPWTKWYEIEVDKNVPKIGSSEPIQLREELTSTVRPYQQDMWIKDNWILEGSIEDESGIESITISGGITGSLSANPTWFERINDDVEKPNYRMKIPVNTTGAGKLSFTIRVLDKSSPQLENIYSISINYDNVAPTIKAYEGATPIQQSNQTYELKGSVEEGNSGFERLVFWFQRNDGDETRVYNPMETRLGDANRTMVNDLDYTDGIPRLALTAVGRPDAYSLSHESINGNKNVRIGGLVKIGGLDRLIISVSGDTIKWADEVDTSIKDAYIAYALVVDNMVIETPVWDGDTLFEIKNDDKDGMVEAINVSGGRYAWSASIDSKNIPDGPIVLHYVVFDKAGNSSVASVVTDISNNPPLLAKVTLGTDLNGNGTVDETEKVPAFSALGGDGKEQAEATVASSAFIAKGLVTAEIDVLGGNGALQYTLKEGDGENFLHALQTLRATEGGTINTITLSETNLANSKPDGERSFVFTIWDSTEMTTAGTNSLSAKLTVPMQVDLIDEVSPVVAIRPFYWNSEKDNSLYENSRNNGHIEITGVYDGTDPDVSGQISIRGTAYDDQRLSALYVYMDGYTFTGGTAKDIGGVSYTRIATYNAGTWAAVDQWATNGWKASIVDAGIGQDGHRVSWQVDIDTARSSAVAAANRIISVVAEDKRVTPNPNASATTASPNVITGTGERPSVNSIKISENNAIRVGQLIILGTGDQAYAARITSYTEGLVSFNVNIDESIEAYTIYTDTHNNPSLQMDIVPYITKVKTSLDSLSPSNPSRYNRTALGRYPVQITQVLNTTTAETITLTGFNLTDARINDAATGIANNTVTGLDFNVATLSSGNLNLTVNGIPILNNSSDNDKEWNKLPNNDNNNLLTDDVVMDVWQFNSRAASPLTGNIANPVMKISPTSGMLGFAFTNGPLYFSMGGYVVENARGIMPAGEYSYVYWQGSYDFMTSTAFAYDSAGRTYGAAAGGDINATQADKFGFMTDRWGVSGAATGGSYGGENALRLEMIAQNGDKNGGGVGTIYFDKNRIKSPEFATARHNSSTNIYMAYFDNLNEEIRFRYGNLRDDPTAKVSFNNFNDAYTNGTVINTGNLKSGRYSTDYVNVIAATNLTDRMPGEFVSLGVISKEGPNVDDVVVLVWYDGYANKLMYTYNTKPTEGTIGANVENWSEPVTIFEDGGEYCKLVVDNAGGIHIAGYDGMTGDLKYAYLPSYNNTAGKVEAVVDSYGIVGQYITLDVVNVNTIGDANYVPYIGYYALSSARPKLAYRVSDTVEDGARDEKYTGAWEISLIPTSYRTFQDTVNVGLWKTATGVIKNSTTGTNINNQVNYGKTYGNGTDNPVLAYAIKESSTKGYIETAQKK